MNRKQLILIGNNLKIKKTFPSISNIYTFQKPKMEQKNCKWNITNLDEKKKFFLLSSSFHRWLWMFNCSSPIIFVFDIALLSILFSMFWRSKISSHLLSFICVKQEECASCLSSLAHVSLSQLTETSTRLHHIYI